MSLINKMNVGNTNYDIQDRLMPDAIGQAGQVLKVKDDGSGLEFGTIESGGKLYRHDIIYNLTVQGYSEPAQWIGHVITNSSINTEEYVTSLIKSLKGIPVVQFNYMGSTAHGTIESLVYCTSDNSMCLDGYDNYPSGKVVTFDSDTVTEL